MIMDLCMRYETVQVTAEDAVFFLLKRSLAELPHGVVISRSSNPGERGAATFVASGARWSVPMSNAVRAVCNSAPTGHQTIQLLAAVAGKRVADAEAEYRTTLKLIDDALAEKPANMEILRGLSVLRGAIATCLAVSCFCLAA